MSRDFWRGVAVGVPLSLVIWFVLGYGLSIIIR